jgi:hypothetical protein
MELLERMLELMQLQPIGGKLLIETSYYCCVLLICEGRDVDECICE